MAKDNSGHFTYPREGNDVYIGNGWKDITFRTENGIELGSLIQDQLRYKLYLSFADDVYKETPYASIEFHKSTQNKIYFIIRKGRI